MRLVHLRAPKKRSLETLVHTGLAVGHILRNRADVAIVFNAANAPWLPFLRAARIPVATHVDGLEWQRAKWGRVGKQYYRLAESLSVRWSDALIADAAGIQDYYRETFDADSSLITYGAPIVERGHADRLGVLGLAPGRFHLVVARFEPENHVDMIVQGYVRSHAKYPLVVVGSAPYAAKYTEAIHRQADGRVRFLGGVWDQELLNELYANAAIYWHGHSVGGTNPSLLRAIGAGAATNAFDVNFNREVLGDAGEYFSAASDIPALIGRAEQDNDAVARRGEASIHRARNYRWEDVANDYESLCRDLVAGDLRYAGKRGFRRASVAFAPFNSGSEGTKSC